MIDSISPKSPPQNTRSNSTDKDCQNSRFLELLSEKENENEVEITVTTNDARSLAQEKPEHQSIYDLRTMQPGSGKTGNDTTNAVKQRGVSELYESKWYAIGHLSYKSQLYKIGTNTEENAIAFRGNRVNPGHSIQSEILEFDTNIATPKESSAKVSVDRELKIHQFSEEKRTSKHSQEAAFIPELVKKRVTFAIQDETLNIYIRDYSLSDLGKKLIVENIIESNHNSHFKVAKITINGEEYQK